MRIRSLLTSAALVIAAVLVSTPTARAVDVVVEEDRYVGSHAIIVPASVDEDTRRRLSTCDGCSWRFAQPCRVDPDSPGPCRSVVRGCPSTRQLLRLWFRGGNEPWSDRGLVCLTDSDIVPVSQLGGEVRERVERQVPGPDPSCQPGRGAVTQLPLVCSSGQGGVVPSWDVSLLGVDVRIQSQPLWTWEFEPGARLSTTSAGGTFPDMSVSHTYRSAGEKRITLTTQWFGTYTADGLGPFALEPIRQVVTVPIVIGQAKAVLTRH